MILSIDPAVSGLSYALRVGIENSRGVCIFLLTPLMKLKGFMIIFMPAISCAR